MIRIKRLGFRAFSHIPLAIGITDIGLAHSKCKDREGGCPNATLDGTLKMPIVGDTMFGLNIPFYDWTQISKIDFLFFV
jgi:hypothetical protein